MSVRIFKGTALFKQWKGLSDAERAPWESKSTGGGGGSGDIVGTNVPAPTAVAAAAVTGANDASTADSSNDGGGAGVAEAVLPLDPKVAAIAAAKAKAKAAAIAKAATGGGGGGGGGEGEGGVGKGGAEGGGGGGGGGGGASPGSLPAPIKQEGESPAIPNKTFAEIMMEKMGYKAGTGLGKNAQGMVETIAESTQLGRHGLGFAVEGLARGCVEDQEIEKVQIKETPEWIPSCPCGTADAKVGLDTFEGWLQAGAYSLDLSVHIHFCTPDLIQELCDAKSLLDTITDRDFRNARNRANPFELIKKEIFGTSRAALKMANIDAACNFEFTNAADKDELLYFSDVCSGPGGFSEYVLWRKKWRAKGFGFTLIGKLDFKLPSFIMEAPCDTFYPYYGVDGRGDIFLSESLREFQKVVTDNTKGAMLHFLSGDGGADYSADQNSQEIILKQLLLCQTAAALLALRKGGHFICKCFDNFTEFSVGLIFLVYQHFDHVSIFKPNTSRQANSERFIVAKGLRRQNPPVAEYLLQVNDRLNEMKSAAATAAKGEGEGDGEAVASEKADVIQIVPRETIMADASFVAYMRKSIASLGWKQVAALKKLHNFIKDPNLPGENQYDIRIVRRMNAMRFLSFFLFFFLSFSFFFMEFEDVDQLLHPPPPYERERGGSTFREGLRSLVGIVC